MAAFVSGPFWSFRYSLYISQVRGWLYLLKQRLIRLRQIEGLLVRLPPAQISGGPVHFDHIAVRVVEIEGEGLVVVDYKLDRNLLLHDARVERSKLGE
jgi:hypothetical protein